MPTPTPTDSTVTLVSTVTKATNNTAEFAAPISLRVTPAPVRQVKASVNR